MFSSLSEESVSISMLKSLIQRNCSYVRLKHSGIYDGVVSWPTVRVPPLHVKREMCVELLINEGHLFFRGGGGGGGRSVMKGYRVTAIYLWFSC